MDKSRSKGNIFYNYLFLTLFMMNIITYYLAYRVVESLLFTFNSLFYLDYFFLKTSTSKLYCLLKLVVDGCRKKDGLGILPSSQSTHSTSKKYTF